MDELVSHNTGSFEERLAFGKAKEAEVIERLKMSFWSVTPATEEQDKYEKVDCWIRWKGVTYSVAIKWREGDYTDLGIAVVRPYNRKAFPLQYAADHVPYDRDYERMCELYVVANPQGLRIVTGHSAKVICNKALEALGKHDQWEGEGYVLKHVLDRGASGYSSGQTRLICYINLDYLKEVELP